MIEKHLETLGTNVVDKVTGFEGMIASITFDAYGCIQAIVKPRIDDKGRDRDGRWFDVSRLEPLGGRILPAPIFTHSPESIAAGKKGPAGKPARDW